MKKVCALILAMILLATPLLALGESFNKKLMSNAKQAVALISYGEYKKALKKLKFSENAPSGDELAAFAQEKLPDVFTVTVQTDVSVAYRIDSVWRVAVPIEEPAYRGVQTLLLRSKDGQSFDGYKAVSWGDVEDDLENADRVIWKDAYDPGSLTIVADN